MENMDTLFAAVEKTQELYDKTCDNYSNGVYINKKLKGNCYEWCKKK